MELDTRMSEVIKVINSSDNSMTPKEITSKFINYPTMSDIATAGHILKIFSFLGLVGKDLYPKGKVMRYKYFKIKNIKVPNGITKRITENSSKS